MADLKAVYAAVDEQAALDLLGALGQEMLKNLPILAGQLGQSQCLFQVPLGGAQTDTPLRALTASYAR